MRFPYRHVITHQPVPTLSGISYRYKPILRVRVASPNAVWYVSGLLDTGSDDTVFPGSLAERLGLQLVGLPVSQAAGVGKGKIAYAVAPVTLAMNDGVEQCTWTALVGFRLDQINAIPLLGHAGFLQFFTAEFHGDTHEVVLTPNSNFPGHLP